MPYLYINISAVDKLNFLYMQRSESRTKITTKIKTDKFSIINPIHCSRTFSLAAASKEPNVSFEGAISSNGIPQHIQCVNHNLTQISKAYIFIDCLVLTMTSFMQIHCVMCSNILLYFFGRAFHWIAISITSVLSDLFYLNISTKVIVATENSGCPAPYYRS